MSDSARAERGCRTIVDAETRPRVELRDVQRTEAPPASRASIETRRAAALWRKVDRASVT